MNDLITIDNNDRFPATADQVMQHVKIIDELKKKVMKRDTHYGVIPGCGDKPALLKPGAEKICLTFRLTTEFDIEVENFPGGHKQYTVNCRLRHRGETFVGQGIGICSTMENKYRYRWDNTHLPVPQEYWNDRDSDLLGGPDYAPRKVKGAWLVFRKVEYDNPADYYNTCAKMAKKRAHVDATLSATAASDIFEQDIDEGLPPSTGDPTPQDDDATRGKPATEAPKVRANGKGGKLATEKQVCLINVKLDQAGLPEKAFLEHFGIAEVAALRFDQVNAALQFIQDNAP